MMWFFLKKKSIFPTTPTIGIEIFLFFLCFFPYFCQTDALNTSGMLLCTLGKNCHASKHAKLLKVQLQKSED